MNKKRKIIDEEENKVEEIKNKKQKEENSKNLFDFLPTCLLLHLLKHFDVPSLLSFSYTNRAHYKLIEEKDKYFWKEKIENEFSDFLDLEFHLTDEEIEKLDQEDLEIDEKECQMMLNSNELKKDEEDSKDGENTITISDVPVPSQDREPHLFKSPVLFKQIHRIFYERNEKTSWKKNYFQIKYYFKQIDKEQHTIYDEEEYSLNDEQNGFYEECQNCDGNYGEHKSEICNRRIFLNPITENVKYTPFLFKPQEAVQGFEAFPTDFNRDYEQYIYTS